MPPGYSLVELTFVTALLTTVGAITVPQLLTTVDDHRAAGATRYVSSRFQQTRMEAIVRSTDVAIRFTRASAGGFEFAVFVDGNRNGVRTRDIQSHVDRPLGASEKLPDQFPGVDFGVLAGLPSPDGGDAQLGGDPIKLGASDLLSFSAAGTSSSGSIYIRGRRNAQYVVRVFGATGKTRVLKFSPQTNRWNPL